MRMWMTPPAWMCRQHLLGEHVELHMFVGTINKGISVRGYLDANMLEPSSLHSRHAALAEEMFRRGYAHRSPLPPVVTKLPLPEFLLLIDSDAATTELLRRCPECAKRAAVEAMPAPAVPDRHLTAVKRPPTRLKAFPHTLTLISHENPLEPLK